MIKSLSQDVEPLFPQVIDNETLVKAYNTHVGNTTAVLSRNCSWC